MTLAAPGDVIGRVRLRTASADSVRARALTERRLEAIDVRPRSLPPSAILLVRRLAPRVSVVGPGAPLVDRAWQAALDTAIDDLARRAVRPGDPDGDAVVFADGAELLAWLARDLARGTASTRWWWTAILGPVAPDVRGLARVLAENAALVPAALARLGATEALTVVAALDTAQALAVLHAVGEAYRVDVAFASARSDGDRIAASTAVSRSAMPPSAPAVRAPARSASRRSPPRAPWAAWLTAGASAVAPALEALLGVSLVLHHAPTLARRRRFALDARAWWIARTAWEEAAGTPPPPSPAPSIDASAGDDRPARDEDARPRVPAHAARAWMALRPLTRAHPRAKARHQERHPARPPQTRGEGRRRRARDARDDRAAVADVHAAPAPRSPDPAVAIDTRLAGVFYLLNVMRALGLPETFEDDWRLASTVGAWGVLDALARALLETTSEDLARDPVWTALATLAGREPGAPLGAGLRVAAYRAPHAWREGDEAPRRIGWAASATRLRLWSEDDGDVLADVPRYGRLARQLPEELGTCVGDSAGVTLTRRRFRRAPPARPRGIHLLGVTEPLVTWLALGRPFVRRRLREALGADGTLVERLLRRDGRVWLTPSHVDVVMPLGAVSLAVRAAGLDADPRWRPDLGRVVAFHYE